MAAPDGVAPGPALWWWFGKRPGSVEVMLATLGLLAVGCVSASLFAPSVVTVLGFAAALLPAVVGGNYPLRRAWVLIWRLRWFYLSLVVFFGWGDGWAEPSGEHGLWVPSRAGLAEAALRIGALMVIAAWVVWLTAVFARPALVRALTVLLAPLGLLGADIRGWSRRLFLTIAYFEAAERVPATRGPKASGPAAGCPAALTVAVPGLPNARQDLPTPPLNPTLVFSEARQRLAAAHALARNWMAEHLAEALAGTRAAPDPGVVPVSDLRPTAFSLRAVSPLLGLLVLMTSLFVFGEWPGLG